MESTFALRKDDFCVRAFGSVFTFAVQTRDGHPGVLRTRTCHVSVQGFQAKFAFSRSQSAKKFPASQGRRLKAGAAKAPRGRRGQVGPQAEK